MELTLASLQYERNAIPAGVVNPEGRSGIRRADRVVRDRVVIEVTRLAVGSDVLSQQRVAALDGRDTAQDLDLCRRMSSSVREG